MFRDPEAGNDDFMLILGKAGGTPKFFKVRQQDQATVRVYVGVRGRVFAMEARG
jgi:hypothetical protein